MHPPHESFFAPVAEENVFTLFVYLNTPSSPNIRASLNSIVNLSGITILVLVFDYNFLIKYSLYVPPPDTRQFPILNYINT